MTETSWEAFGQHGDSELLKLFGFVIQDGLIKKHRYLLQRSGDLSMSLFDVRVVEM